MGYGYNSQGLIDTITYPSGNALVHSYIEGDEVNADLSGRLAKEAVRLNKALGDPTKL